MRGAILSVAAPIPMPYAHRQTAVFAKLPTPGTVKTRLCPFLSPEEAADLQGAMLADLGDRLASDPRCGEVALIHTPPDAGEALARGAPGFDRFVPQVGEGLGQRLAAHFRARGESMPEGSGVVLGSDVPLASLEGIDRAHGALEGGADLVLALDGGGGYSLVGVRGDHPELFTSIPMSTDDMAQATLDLARRKGLEVALVEVGFDVDLPADLGRLRRALASATETSLLDPFLQRTRQVLARLPWLSSR